MGRVPCIEPFRGALPPDIRLWMRWVESDRDNAQLEIASAPWDGPSYAAQVMARAVMPDRRDAWMLWRVAQVQGILDLFLAGPDGGASEVLHLLVFANLSDLSAELGLSVVPFPGEYRYLVTACDGCPQRGAVVPFPCVPRLSRYPCVIRLPVPVYGHAPRLPPDLEVDMRGWWCVRYGDALAWVWERQYRGRALRAEPHVRL